jgi:hypothetical protein
MIHPSTHPASGSDSDPLIPTTLQPNSRLIPPPQVARQPQGPVVPRLSILSQNGSLIVIIQAQGVQTLAAIIHLIPG